ncbi:LBP_cg2779 family protein [Lapidilactobacillus mulanensis]|uniref:LBP_cg2779 family protein n=1 Tax=Lapidilactobacillus mulanensis TaxID=2485999 RepID=A0ABW4DNK2_9LACO|nr:LBP_cg2779 family protein [Lapidilactobacillus mulanensis]
MSLPKIAEELIDLQKRKELTDTQIAFESHFSVEKLHQIKAGEFDPSDEDIKHLSAYLASKK